MGFLYSGTRRSNRPANHPNDAFCAEHYRHTEHPPQHRPSALFSLLLAIQVREEHIYPPREHERGDPEHEVYEWVQNIVPNFVDESTERVQDT